MLPKSRLLVLIAIAVLAAGGTATLLLMREPDRVFTVRGVVVTPHAEGAIVIRHDPVPGFMPAMTMPFHADAGEAAHLGAGDVVEFELRVGQDTSRATKFRRLGRAAMEQTRLPAPPAMRRLRNGDAVPEFALTDQDGATFARSDLQGRPTILTFMFTRCPIPEFCPLLGRKFQALQRELAALSLNARLASITLDPEHDTPEVLKKYGESLEADFGRWLFLTGPVQTIDRLARLFVVRTERRSDSIDHSLATALIGPDGRVVEIWRGNAWKPGEILAAVQGLKPGND